MGQQGIEKIARRKTRIQHKELYTTRELADLLNPVTKKDSKEFRFLPYDQF